MARFPGFWLDQRGVSVPFAAVSVVMLITLVGLVYDLGHLYVVKQELQNAADAGANAGAEAIYMTSSVTNPVPGTTLCDVAQSVALATVKLNKSDGKALDIPAADVQIGLWEYTGGKWAFTPAPCSNSINAIRVITRRTEAVNGAVPTLFARFLGKDFTDVSAQAIAMLGWVKKLKPGCGFPIALGDKFVPPPGGRLAVRFAPDQTDTGAWHTFTDPSASANDLKKLVSGEAPSPGVSVGDLIYLNNGWDTSVLHEMRRQLSAHDGHWLVILPVINADQSFNQTLPVLGFCAFEVTQIGPPGNKFVEGYALGGYVAPVSDEISPVRDEDNSMRSSLPKLVQ
jgi:hypothetical protein